MNKGRNEENGGAKGRGNGDGRDVRRGEGRPQDEQGEVRDETSGETGHFHLF